MSVVEQHRPEEAFNPHYRFCGFYPPRKKTTYTNGWSALAGTRACQYGHYEMTRDTGLSDRQMLGARHWEFDPNHLPGFNIPLGLVDYPKVCWGAKVLYGYLAFPRLDGSADPDIESMAAVMAVSIGTIKQWLTELIEHGFIRQHSLHPGNFAPLPHPSLLMPTELAHARAALIRHVATFDSVASLDAWLEAKTEEDPLLNSPLPLAEAIRQAGYILAARAALHVKSINWTTKS